MNKVCPVVQRKRNGQTEILVFRHPLAGTQLVKGTVEPGEANRNAAERELAEEAGVALMAGRQLLVWQLSCGAPVWHIYLMQNGDHLPDTWTHYCADDKGHLFSFYWHPLWEIPDASWHPIFVAALAVIREAWPEIEPGAQTNAI